MRWPRILSAILLATNGCAPFVTTVSRPRGTWIGRLTRVVLYDQQGRPYEVRALHLDSADFSDRGLHGNGRSVIDDVVLVDAEGKIIEPVWLDGTRVKVTGMLIQAGGAFAQVRLHTSSQPTGNPNVLQVRKPIEPLAANSKNR